MALVKRRLISPSGGVSDGLAHQKGGLTVADVVSDGGTDEVLAWNTLPEELLGLDGALGQVPEVIADDPGAIGLSLEEGTPGSRDGGLRERPQ